MAKKETIIILDKDLQDQVDLSGAMEGVVHGAKELADQIDRVFDKVRVDMAGYCRQMSDQLLSLRLNLGKLKQAFLDAVAPVAAAVLPAVNAAVRAVTSLVRNIGAVLGLLFSAGSAQGTLAENTDKAAQAQTSLGRAVKRTLAGFDQLNRLGGSGGSSGGDEDIWQADYWTLSPQVHKIAEKLRSLLEPLTKIDLSPLGDSLQRLKTALGALAAEVGPGLEQLWHQVLVPLAKWFIESAAPASVEVLTAAVGALKEALKLVLDGILILRPYLEPIVAFIGQSAVAALQALAGQMETVATVFRERGSEVRLAVDLLGRSIGSFWEGVRPALESLRSRWLATFESLSGGINGLVSGLVSALQRLTGILNGTVEQGWLQGWDGLKSTVKNAVNGMIGLFNGLLSALNAAAGGLCRVVNSLQLRVPDLDIFGSLAGQQLGLNMASVTVPKIPYLAQGAVLPANRPFLAMVGDQRHGTNVEAPLATIQEAVAGVLAQNDQGAVVDTLERILEAVLQIRIGDDAIGSAAERYARKMAIVRGGYV